MSRHVKTRRQKNVQRAINRHPAPIISNSYVTFSLAENARVRDRTAHRNSSKK